MANPSPRISETPVQNAASAQDAVHAREATFAPQSSRCEEEAGAARTRDVAPAPQPKAASAPQFKAASAPQPKAASASQPKAASASRPKRANPIVRLLGFADGNARLTLLGCILSAAHALLTIGMLVCVWFVVRDLIAVAPAWGTATSAPHYGVAALIFALAALVVYFVALICTHVAAFRTATNMRRAALEHLAHVPLGYFSTHATGELRRIIEGSTALTEGVLAHRIPDFIGALVTPLAFVVCLVVFDWVLGLLCLVPVAVSIVCMMSMMAGGGSDENSNVMTFMKNYQDALQDMNKAAVEYVRGIPVVKVFQQTVASFRTFSESIRAYCTFATRYVRMCERPQVAQLVAINSTFAVLVPAGIIMARATGDFAGFLTDFLFYVILSALTTLMMTKIMYSSQALTEADDALRRIEGILDAPRMSEVSPAAAQHAADASVELRDVRFTYPGNETPALDGVSLRVPAGATVALVGPSGGGKTTLASLIPRFWDVDEGSVLVGGADVRHIAVAELMDQVAFVFQNEALFKQSLLENIRAARPHATRVDVERAAHAAQCDDIIAKVPHGLDAQVGTNGVYLSGGERQRIALARAILKDAPIVVLDEATAFADPENEALIQQALAELCRGKTVLMIAHRLSTVVSADCICVVDAGRIVEQGTHAELVAAGGLYARMWEEYRQSVSWRITSSAPTREERTVASLLAADDATHTSTKECG